MRYPSRTVGNAALVQNRVVSTQFVRLVGVVGHNTDTVDRYVQVHETTAAPAANAVPLFSVLATAGLPYSFALPNPVDLAACTVTVSNDLEKYTASTGTLWTIQALIAP